MKKLTYECMECEDTESWNEVLKEGFHCECGGHLFLVKTDNFERIGSYTDCLVCKNKGTDECVDCTRR